MKLWSKLRSLFGIRKFDAEMAEEMRLHLEMQTEQYIAAGMDRAEARHAALRKFGGVEQVKERCRDQRGWFWLEQTVQDLRFAARTLRSNPGFTFVVVAVLALGIGANTTVFSVVDALLLRSLPIMEPEKLMVVAAGGSTDGRKDFPYPLFDKGGRNFAIPYTFFESIQSQNVTTADVAAVSGWTMLRPLITDAAGSTIESANVEEVSGNYFSVLGLTTVLGRSLAPEDDRPGNAAPVTVISEAFWRDRYNSDPSVIGKVLRLGDVPLTIVGVAARRFAGARVGTPVALWVPINLSPQIDGSLPWGTGALKSETSPWIHILVRLRPGVSREQSEAELNVAYQRKLAQLDPRRLAPPTNKEWERLREQHLELHAAGTGYAGLRPDFEKPASILMALVAFMQVVACANVAGLLLARGATRQREFALRTALGAGRVRLIRQMLTESVLLAGIAGVIGIGLAEVGTRYLANEVAGVALWADWRVMAFTLVVSLVTGLGLGLIPALRLSAHDLTQSIKESGAAGRQWLNSVLVVAQVAVAFLLLVTAGLFARSLFKLVHADPGFQREHRTLFDLNVPARYSAEQRFLLYQRIQDAMATLPEVETVSHYQGFSLLGDTAFAHGFTTPSYVPAPGENLQARIGRVGPGFFAAMGIPLLRGSDIEEGSNAVDRPGVPPLVIGAWSARRLFGDADPIGKHIKLDVDFQIVGVAKDVKYGGMRDVPGFVFYVSLKHRPNESRITFVARTRGVSTLSARTLKAAIGSVDPEAQISGLRTIAERLDQDVSRERLIARLAGFFGALALAFAAMGLFGLMSYIVNWRTREFGVRMALGASAGCILRMVMRQGVVLGLLGSAAGLVGAFGLTRFVESLLYETPSMDSIAFGAAMLGLMLILLLAAAIPAQRAAKADPMVALRCE